MKKTVILSMAAAILALFSCAKIQEADMPESRPGNPNEKTYIIHGVIDEADTKTTYEESGDKALFSWLEADAMKVVVYEAADPTHVDQYSFYAQSAGRNVDFSGSADFDSYPSSGFAVYPNSLSTGGVKDSYLISLPAAYSVPGSNFSQIGIPLIGAQTSEDQYSFKAAVGVLKITLTDVPVSARKLVLTSTEDNLSGVFPLDETSRTEGIQMSRCTADAGHSITVTFPQQTAGATVGVFVPVPVGTLSTGATFDVQDNDGYSIKKVTTKKDITILRGHLQPLQEIAVEVWNDVGVGKFIDNHTFYQAEGFCDGQRVTPEIGLDATYFDVLIQQNAANANQYRVVNPYGALFADPVNTTHFGTGPNAHLYFTLYPGLGTDLALFDSVHTGIKQYGGYYGEAELWYDHPYWGYSQIYQNSRVIKRDGSGNPLNIQFAPFYMGGLDEDCSVNPKIEVVFPGSAPMLAFNYAGDASASYSGGKVSATIGGETVTAIKAIASDTFNNGVEAILAGTGDILTFTATGTQPLVLPDGNYVLVYKVETDEHGFVFKNGGNFSVSSRTKIALDDSMISVSIDAGTKDGTSHYDGIGKVALTDGDESTFWHTPWQEKGSDYYGWSDLDPTYGAYIDIDLGSGKSVTDFELEACLRAAYSAWPKHIIVYSKPDGGSWTKVGEAENACYGVSGGVPTWIYPIQCSGAAARFIRISIIENNEGIDLRDAAAAGCTHLAELELYGTLYDGGEPVSPWLNLFTDLSYSELKPGTTQGDISAMNGIPPYFLAENVAQKLFDGTYPDPFFRIGSYDPYSDIRCGPPALMTRIYSALDNPTGIQVNAGDQLLVCVDQIPAGQAVSLAVYGDAGDEPNVGGSKDWQYGYTENWAEGYDQNVELLAGMNTIDITATGMLYVLNTITQADPYNPVKTAVSSYAPVKVHILPGYGTVQGYFDPAHHSNSEGDALLQGCTYKYFMVKGQKCSFLFHTDPLKAFSAETIRTGSEVMDKAVTWQKQLCGIDGESWFNNHLLVASTEGSAYMNAGHRRILISTDNIPKVVSKAYMLTEEGEGGWGPFHEMGHLHQHPINWKSTAESSNNLFSNYCKKMLANQESVTFVSRGAPLRNLAESYAQAKPWVLLGTATYQSEDTELHMRMNWQLWNYFHLCGHDTSFFPNLFNYLRQPSHMLSSEYGYWYYWYTGKEDNPGKAQLEYYEACCEVAQQDLTEFFDAWGFFVPVDMEYYQYGTKQYTVTASMISQAKARVAAKGYPKAAPIQYLEDRQVATYGENPSYTYSQMGYYTQFQGAAPVVSAPQYLKTASNVALMFDNDNAVAVELRAGSTASGALLYFSNLNYIQLPDGLSFDGNSIWAVQADGVRVKASSLE